MELFTICIIALCVLFAVVISFGGHFIEKFWDWYDDAVWDEREENQSGSDDFPDSK